MENWDINSGSDVSGTSNSMVTAVFYIKNTGLAPDSCFLGVGDSLGWDIQPRDYYLNLNPGQQDSVFFDIQIPSVPVGTTDKINLWGISLTNPYVIDEDSLYISCESYNVTINEISDVGNDEGKQVKIKWSSYPASDPLVSHFSVFRRNDPILHILSKFESEKSSPKHYPPGDWYMVGTYPAYGETTYLVTAPTLKDSTISDGMYWSVFFIRAGTDNPIVYFDSPIDSGYSLDNLFPSPPTGLVASHQPAATQLLWHPTSSPDFDYYTIYRDTSAEFTPDPDRKLAYTVDTAFVDSTAQLGRTYYYVTTASDFSGNKSSPSNEAAGIRYMTGDVNANGVIDVGDVVYLTNYLFKGGLSPRPIQAGDINCSGVVDVGDVVYLINYLFKGGLPPSC